MIDSTYNRKWIVSKDLRRFKFSTQISTKCLNFFLYIIR